MRLISQPYQVVRAYYRGIGKTGVIYPAAFLMSCAMGQVVLGLIFHARDTFGASPLASATHTSPVGVQG